MYQATKLKLTFLRSLDLAKTFKTNPSIRNLSLDVHRRRNVWYHTQSRIDTRNSLLRERKFVFGETKAMPWSLFFSSWKNGDEKNGDKEDTDSQTKEINADLDSDWKVASDKDINVKDQIKEIGSLSAKVFIQKHWGDHSDNKERKTITRESCKHFEDSESDDKEGQILPSDRFSEDQQDNNDFEKESESPITNFTEDYDYDDLDKESQIIASEISSEKLLEECHNDNKEATILSNDSFNEKDLDDIDYGDKEIKILTSYRFDEKNLEDCDHYEENKVLTSKKDYDDDDKESTILTSGNFNEKDSDDSDKAIGVFNNKSFDGNIEEHNVTKFDQKECEMSDEVCESIKERELDSLCEDDGLNRECGDVSEEVCDEVNEGFEDLEPTLTSEETFEAEEEDVNEHLDKSQATPNDEISSEDSTPQESPSDITTYKNEIYFTHGHYTFYDYLIDMKISKDYFSPVPNSKEPEKWGPEQCKPKYPEENSKKRKWSPEDYAP